MEVVCWKCGNVWKVQPDKNGRLPGLYEPLPPCPECGSKGCLGHKIKEDEG